MFHRTLPTLASASTVYSSRWLRRGVLSLAVCGSALLLGGCGGGGDNTVSLGVNAIVGGQPLTTEFVPGPVGTIDIVAGQSIELDANEPVDWGFSVNGSPLFGSGTTVFFNGLAITETAVSPSRVVLQTSVNGGFPSPVVVTMSATSTIDAAQVAVVNLVVH